MSESRMTVSARNQMLLEMANDKDRNIRWAATQALHFLDELAIWEAAAGPGAGAAAMIHDLQMENQRLRRACAKSDNDIQQFVGKALGYPWFKDDQKNFPGSSEADGVAVGEHVGISLVMELHGKWEKTKAAVRLLRGRLIDEGHGITDADDCPSCRAVVETKEFE